MYLEIKDPDFMAKLDKAVKFSFSNPRITIKNKNVVVKLSKGKDPPQHVYDKVLYMLEQYDKNQGCDVRCRFTKDSLNFLRKLPEYDTEHSGDLYLGERKTGVFKILCKKNLRKGSDENVLVLPTRINFHSHPRKTYKTKGVKYAWPSLTDFLGYLKLGKKTIFHCVSTIEGIYIISFSKYWVDNISKIPIHFIKENYNVSGKSNITPINFVNKINKIKLKGESIFRVKYLPWYGSNTIFSVSYSMDGYSCKLD